MFGSAKNLLSYLPRRLFASPICRLKSSAKKAGNGFLAGSLALSVCIVPVLPNGAKSEGFTPVATNKSNDTYHASVLRIPANASFPVARNVKIGMNKSLLVELPVEVRDVLVSNPKMVEAVVSSSNRVYLIGMQMGQANAFLFDKNGTQILTLEISVERDTLALKRLLKRLIPGSDIKIELLNDTIVLTGSVRTPGDASRAAKLAARFVTRPGEDDKIYDKKVINMLSVGAKEQVLLKVTVAEMDRNMLKQMGINLGANLSIGKFAYDMLTNNAFPLTGAALAADAFASQIINNSNATVGGSSQSLVKGSGFGTTYSGKSQASAAVRLLERNGLAHTLAEPTLTAISGETASFQAGGEFPIPVSQDDGKISIEWKKFGVGLSFTPMVLAEERISLKISTEVSDLTDEGAVQLNTFSVKALEVRRTDTTVELPSGGGLVISGLISKQTRQNIDGIPGAKNLPVLGKLFRSKDFKKNETELVVLVTPYLVNPIATPKIARPDDGFAPASDLESKLLGHLNRVYRSPQGGFKDAEDYGFIVE